MNNNDVHVLFMTPTAQKDNYFKVHLSMACFGTTMENFFNVTLTENDQCKKLSACALQTNIHNGVREIYRACGVFVLLTC